MINISYTISPRLRDSLLEIEALKRKVLLPPLSFRSELSLWFDAVVSRIYFTVKPESFSKKELTTLLTLGASQNVSPFRKRHIDDIYQYKKGLDYITNLWYVNPKPFTPRDASHLQTTAFGGKLKVSQEILNDLFLYLRNQAESPILQAGITLSQMARLEPFTKENILMAHLLSLVYLYKNGYDMRGLVVPEEEFVKEEGVFKQMLGSAIETDNQTLWLEYFAEVMVRHLKALVEKVAQRRIADGWTTEVPSTDESDELQVAPIPLIDLNERQRGIINLLAMPYTKVTNRIVQDAFKVSQITASRDLSHLARLGLAVTHGRGRSIYYTRV